MRISKKIEQDNGQFQAATTLKSIINFIPGHIYWKGVDFKFRGCNQMQAESAGFSCPEDLIGKDDFEMPWKSDAHLLRAMDTQVIKEGKTLAIEEPSLLKDGRERIFLSQKSPLKDASGAIIGLLGVSIDITDQKKSEHLKQQLLIEAKTIESLKSLAGTVAHEMRTPLASIGSFATTLERVLPELVKVARAAKEAGIATSIPNRDLEYLEEVGGIMNSTVKRSNIFIDNLLRNLNETTPERLETISVTHLVQHTLDNYPESIRGNVPIHVNTDPNFLLRGRLEMLMHILFNLLKNAIHYVQEAHKGEIRIWTELDQPYNVLHFQDTGTGIAADMLPNLFRYFFSKTRHGTGVGLAYAKLTMENIGGRISCESRENEYTHFKLFFPIVTVS